VDAEFKEKTDEQPKDDMDSWLVENLS